MKLDICGGDTKIFKDFLNVDGRPGPKVDIVADIRKPLPFKDGEAEEILSVATLEHLIFIQGERLIAEFYRILQHGGKLTVAVPDLKKVIKAYQEKKLPQRIINNYIHGQLTETTNFEYDCHKSSYDFEIMKAMLSRAGFIDIREVPYDFPMHRKDLMMKIICKKI